MSEDLPLDRSRVGATENRRRRPRPAAYLRCFGLDRMVVHSAVCCLPKMGRAVRRSALFKRIWAEIEGRRQPVPIERDLSTSLDRVIAARWLKPSDEGGLAYSVTDAGLRAYGADRQGNSLAPQSGRPTVPEAVAIVHETLTEAKVDGTYRYDPRVSPSGGIQLSELERWTAYAGVSSKVFDTAFAIVLRCGCVVPVSCCSELDPLVVPVQLPRNACDAARHVSDWKVSRRLSGPYTVAEVQSLILRYLGAMEVDRDERAERYPDLNSRNRARRRMLYWPIHGAPLTEIELVAEEVFPGIWIERSSAFGRQMHRPLIPRMLEEQIARFPVHQKNWLHHYFAASPFPQAGELAVALRSLLEQQAIVVAELPDFPPDEDPGWYGPVFRVVTAGIAANKGSEPSPKPIATTGSGELIPTPSAPQGASVPAGAVPEHRRKRGRPPKTAPDKIDKVVDRIIKACEHEIDDPRKWKTLCQKYAKRLPTDCTPDRLRMRVARRLKASTPAR